MVGMGRLRYKHFYCYTTENLKDSLPFKFSFWHKFFDSVLVLYFSGSEKPEQYLKENFPESAGIIVCAEDGEIVTIVVIFREDIEEDKLDPEG